MKRTQTLSKPWAFLLWVVLPIGTDAFLSNSIISQRRRAASNLDPPINVLGAIKSTKSGSDRSPSRVNKNDLLLIDWGGGCVVDTVQWRIQVAYRAAPLLWPELSERVDAATSEVATATSEQQTSWLTNKLEAIASVLQEDTRYFSATAQFVLAVRLLLEEQELDQGRSPSTGKYGSLYHPQQHDDSQNEHGNDNDNDDDNAGGSRPLTVSEVAANWCEFLLDTLPIKYRVRPNQLEEAIETGAGQSNLSISLPLINTAIMPMLATIANGQGSINGGELDSQNRRTIPVVTVRHQADLALAAATLSEHFKESQVQIVGVEGEDQIFENKSTKPVVYVLLKQRDTVWKLLESCGDSNSSPSTEGPTLHVVESSWDSLQREKIHTDHPLVGTNGVNLKLTAWCSTPEMERLATMDPWSSACTSIMELEDQLGLYHSAFE